MTTALHRASLLADGFLFVAGSFLAICFVLSLFAFFNPNSNGEKILISPGSQKAHLDKNYSCSETLGSIFYDDPNLSYSIEKPMEGWDRKRSQWLTNNPTFKNDKQNRVLLVTGSQTSPCHHTEGDHFMLRFFKNKVDYCRLHGYDIFFNNLLLHPLMTGYWAKYPIVKAAMLAHPEAEWIWWIDSDAAITDMEFKLPLERYKNHNLVVYGWKHLVFEKKSWTSLNAGVFLIRNCQWSVDFIEALSRMSPQSPDYVKWGQIQRSTLTDKVIPEADDQSGFVYLLIKENEKWGSQIFIEDRYYLSGYWLEIVDNLSKFDESYTKFEKIRKNLKRRHAEKHSECRAQVKESYVKRAGYEVLMRRKPFITHFTGCEPCSGNHNPNYSWRDCWEGMQKALNFADNQVLRMYGFVHPDLLNTSRVDPD